MSFLLRSCAMYTLVGTMASGLLCGSALSQTCRWEPVGGGINGTPFQMAVFDDGRGPALYVRGISLTSAGGVPVSGIARWDGTTWSAAGEVGVSPIGGAMVTFNDGNETALYSGGGALGRSEVAQWDGAAWSVVGEGIRRQGFEQFGVLDLAVFDDGTGEALYAGGDFFGAIDIVGRWDGQTWSQVGFGLSAPVTAMGVFDSGSGSELYAATGHVLGNDRSFMRWDGISWRGLPGVANGRVYSLQPFHDGESTALYVGGFFTTVNAQPIPSLARWDGTAWSSIGFGPSFGVSALTVHDDGRGPALYIGGYFSSAGSVPARNIARWDGKQFEALGEGIDGRVQRLFEFDDGTGMGLYAVGSFATAGGAPAMNIARWTCSTCYADCDASTGVGVLDLFDFLCFQNSFVSGESYACDCDTSTGVLVCDLFDFLCFQGAFVAGCP